MTSLWFTSLQQNGVLIFYPTLPSPKLLAHPIYRHTLLPRTSSSPKNTCIFDICTQVSTAEMSFALPQ